MIAIDANAVVALLVESSRAGHTSRSMYADHDLVAPDLLPYEVTSALRRLCNADLLTTRVAESALTDLAALRVSAIPHGDISRRIWSLRHNLSAYDAAYVAVAEMFDVPLLTFDARVRSAPGTACGFVDV